MKMLNKEEKLMSDFIKLCLEIDPSSRLSCEQALKH